MCIRDSANFDLQRVAGCGVVGVARPTIAAWARRQPHQQIDLRPELGERRDERRHRQEVSGELISPRYAQISTRMDPMSARFDSATDLTHRTYAIESGEVTLHVETLQASEPKIDHRSVLLLSEAEAPSSRWPTELLTGLARRVGRCCWFDTRDVGASTWTEEPYTCLLYTSPSPRDRTRSRMPSSA